MKNIMIVEDDPEICDVLRAFFLKEGYTLTLVSDGIKAKTLLAKEMPDIILLDLMLPLYSGDELLTIIRKTSNVPIIVISAKDTTQNKVDLLKMGADDYITKPFNLNEVLARVETVLRRFNVNCKDPIAEKLLYKDIEIDKRAAKVIVNGVTLTLTVKEYNLLLLLVENPQKAFTKFQIYSEVWGDSYGADENTLNAHISVLRKKLKEASPYNTYIETLYGIGYRLE